MLRPGGCPHKLGLLVAAQEHAGGGLCRRRQDQVPEPNHAFRLFGWPGEIEWTLRMEARRFQFGSRGVRVGRTERESLEAFTPPLQRRTQPVRVLHLGPEDTEQFEIGVGEHDEVVRCRLSGKIGRASGRERVCTYVSISGGAVYLKKK